MSTFFSAQLNGPKSTQMQLKSVKTGHQFNSSCTQNHVQLFTTFHTMKEFWFFSFSSSLICCLKNSILCSRKVAWISHTRTKDLKFFNSVQISDICTLPMLWASSRNLDACFSAWSAGQPWTCFIRFSLKCAASVGVNEHVGRTDGFCGAGVEFDALLLEVWFGPGDGLLWLLERWRLRGEAGSWPACLSAITGCWGAAWEAGPCLTPGVATFCWDDTGGVVIKGLSGTVLVCGVLILGDTYDLGDEASDVKDIGDWLDGWACVDSCAAWEIREVILKADGPAVRILWSIDYFSPAPEHRDEFDLPHQGLQPVSTGALGEQGGQSPSFPPPQSNGIISINSKSAWTQYRKGSDLQIWWRKQNCGTWWVFGIKGSNWKLTGVAGPGMDALGQHTSTYGVLTWVRAGPSIEGLTQLLEICLSLTHLLSLTQRFPTSCELFISYIPFKSSY